MKPYLIFVLSFLLGLSLHPLLGQAKKPKIKVLLDPGHGGTDSGAVGINGILEKEVALAIAIEAIRLNKELYYGELELYLTRYSDTLISHGDRTRLAKALDVDLFLAIHCNQAERKAAQGLEVYAASDTESPFVDLSLNWGAHLTKELNGQLGIKDRGIKRANFQVLRETKDHCPALLLEIGFISNREEAIHSGRKRTRTAIALAILESIFNYTTHDRDF